MAQQLTVFVENRMGRMQSISDKLAKSNINIRAFALQDRSDYGLLKMIVNDPKAAHLALSDLGCACALKEILAISVPDKPGNFDKLMTALAEGNVNIVDAYGFVLQPENTGVCCIEIDELLHSNAEQVVRDAGFEVLADDELYNM